jgi:hemerythrin
MRLVLITWNDSFSVNVAELDEQHKTLIALINDLNDAMSVGKGRDVLGRILNDLSAYTATHFRTEERYFAQYKYPDTFNHRIEHIAFAKKVAQFSEAYANGNIPLTTEVLKRISDWWKHHILETDKKYSQFFFENGLK